MMVPKDIVLYDEAEIEALRGTINHVVSIAFAEGKTLYESK
jgi:hypothetical protein